MVNGEAILQRHRMAHSRKGISNASSTVRRRPKPSRRCGLHHWNEGRRVCFKLVAGKGHLLRAATEIPDDAGDAVKGSGGKRYRCSKGGEACRHAVNPHPQDV